MTTTLVGRDHVGPIAEHGGIRFYVTECCRASAKGSAGSPTGVCCRACYLPVDPALGGIPEQPEGSPGADMLEEDARLQQRHRLATVTAALERVGQWLHPEATVVDRLSPGLYLVANPQAEEGSSQASRHVLVLDEYPLTRVSAGTGTVCWASVGYRVAVFRGRGVDRDGLRTPAVTVRHRQLCEQLGAELLPGASAR